MFIPPIMYQRARLEQKCSITQSLLPHCLWIWIFRRVRRQRPVVSFNRARNIKATESIFVRHSRADGWDAVDYYRPVNAHTRRTGAFAVRVKFKLISYSTVDNSLIDLIDYWKRVTTRIIQWLNHYRYTIILRFRLSIFIIVFRWNVFSNITYPSRLQSPPSLESTKIQFTILRKRVFPISISNRSYPIFERTRTNEFPLAVQLVTILHDAIYNWSRTLYGVNWFYLQNIIVTTIFFLLLVRHWRCLENGNCVF